MGTYPTFHHHRSFARGLSWNEHAYESFNQSVTWVAPKNKVYSLSNSLQNCIALAVALNGLGTREFYTVFLGRLGIVVTSDVENWLSQTSVARDKQIAKAKTPKAKKRRVKRCHDNLLVKTVVAKRERALREGN